MGKAKDKKNVECYNCHKTGHYKHNCWAKGGGKEGQSPRSKKWSRGKPKSESASTTDDKAVEGAWMAMTEDSLVELSPECDFVKLGIPQDHSLPFSAEGDAYAMIETVTTTTPSNNGHTLELYDLGASHHMTPYLHLLEDYSPTADKLINVANQQSFRAVGTGNLHITVPNGKSTTPIMLKKVLYTPEIATTLVC